MPQLWIEATASPGTDIRDAARLAIRLAARADCGVRLTFNGVQIPVQGGTAIEEVFHDYRRKLAEARVEPDPEVMEGDPD